MSQRQTVLTQIVQDKLAWIKQQKQRLPLGQFQSQLKPSDRNFYQALSGQQTAFILECKKASPSKGLIRADFDVAAIAKAYRPYAAVISVLTDEKYFQGQFDYLRQVSQQVHQPILCKDFMVDPYQIYLARYHQADAILLMLSILDDKTYCALREIAHHLNMGVLTEVSNESELDRAILLDAPVIGINHRNLHDLSISLEKTAQFAPKIPSDRLIISESGIHTHQQIRALSPYNHGFLVGSALMQSDNLPLALRQLIFGDNKVCGLTRQQDAQAAYQAGAIYGGLIFATDSPRYVSLEQAKSLIQSAPLHWVGVFRQTAIADIIKMAHQLPLYAVQLHDAIDESQLCLLRQQLPAQCQIWQAVAGDAHPSEEAKQHIARFVFDHGQGGTGQTFDWELIKKSPLSINKSLLAGGLNEQNLQTALTIGCAGLDVNSGVESSPGIKNNLLIQRFFSVIRQY